MLNENSYVVFPKLLALAQVILDLKTTTQKDGKMARLTTRTSQHSMRFHARNDLNNECTLNFDIMNMGSFNTAVSVTIDDEDMFKNGDTTNKGTEIDLTHGGFCMDLCGVRGAKLTNSIKVDLSLEDIESELFQLSTVHDDVPDSTGFIEMYTTAKKFLDDNNLTFINVIFYADCTIDDAAFGELVNGINDLSKG